MPPPFEPPHAVIDPSALRAAKAYLFEEVQAVEA
jgi:hypothetical protein